MMFPLWHIALSSVAGTGSAILFPLVARKWLEVERLVDMVGFALVVGVSILLGRSACNVGVFNDDPIPLVSPNDVLCPLLTWVGLGMYGAFRPELARFEKIRTMLTVISFLVNVITI